jgi:hypothetical protein
MGIYADRIINGAPPKPVKPPRAPKLPKKYWLSYGEPTWDPVRKATFIKIYVVLTSEGKLKCRKGSGGHMSVMAYKQPKRAENAAKNEGDSVMAVEINLKTEPVFIRKKEL